MTRWNIIQAIFSTLRCKGCFDVASLGLFDRRVRFVGYVA